jgi:hypothetical protein
VFLVTGAPLANPAIYDHVENKLKAGLQRLFGTHPKGKSPPGVQRVNQSWLDTCTKKRRSVRGFDSYTVPNLMPCMRVDYDPKVESALKIILGMGFNLKQFDPELTDSTLTEPLVPFWDDEGNETALGSESSEGNEASPASSPIPAEVSVKPVVEASAPEAVPGTLSGTVSEAVSQQQPSLTLAALAMPALEFTQTQPPVNKLERKGYSESPEAISKPSKAGRNSASAAKALSTPRPIKAEKKSKSPVKQKEKERESVPVVSKGRSKKREPEPESEESEQSEENENSDEGSEQSDEDQEQSESESEEQSASDTDSGVEMIHEESRRRRHTTRARREEHTPIELDTEVRSENEDITTISRRQRYQRALSKEIGARLIGVERHLDVQRKCLYDQEKISDRQEQQIKELYQIIDDQAQQLQQITMYVRRSQQNRDSDVQNKGTRGHHPQPHRRK